MSQSVASQPKLTQFQQGLHRQALYTRARAAFTPRGPARQDCLRVLCWNVERGYQPDALARYIAHLDPDVTLLQEVDWGNARTGGLDVLDYLARQTGLQGLFGIEFYELETPYRTPGLAGGGVHGNAILSRLGFLDSYRIELPVVFDWEAPAPSEKSVTWRQRRLGSRFALCADVECGSSRITLCSAHLENIGGDPDGRVRQLQSLVTQLNARSPDTLHIVAGDFNTLGSWLTQLVGITRSTPAKPWLLSECSWWQRSVLPGMGYLDTADCRQWTYRAYGFYRQKLDWILLNRPVHVLQQGAGGFNSSDHRPIWVDIDLHPEP